MARKCLGSIAASAHAASWGSGGITTRRPSRSPSRSKRAAKASKSAIDFRTPRPIRVGPATNSRSPLDETHVSGATLSASGFQNPSARMTLRRPHWPFRRPEKWTITVGTRKPGEQSRCSSLLSSFHFQESAWHLRKEGKKTPYGKWEKSHSGARRSDEWAAVALPGTLSGATFTGFHRSILHRCTTLSKRWSGLRETSLPRATPTSAPCMRPVHFRSFMSLDASGEPFWLLKRAS
mmetsp:Transcript_11517/g.33350  ORF Transcript_11517/g.33350 Transcript_11517/m.33350 type:complete len:236 (+) Transcript_11517:878-1585(+)